jgi:hypothetical protein
MKCAMCNEEAIGIGDIDDFQIGLCTKHFDTYVNNYDKIYEWFCKRYSKEECENKSNGETPILSWANVLIIIGMINAMVLIIFWLLTL